MEEIPVGVYEHYKGQRYLVLGEVPHEETGERLVLYRPEGKYDPCSVRSKLKTEFLETILVEGTQIPQFKFISPMNEATQSAQGPEIVNFETPEEAVADFARKHIGGSGPRPYGSDGCSFNSRQ